MCRRKYQGKAQGLIYPRKPSFRNLWEIRLWWIHNAISNKENHSGEKRVVNHDTSK